ncbi:hypothetical protein OH77DRAFT_1085259 [Trametes cingulata]|nr:hypothetical protein OH77DRAFT_1085259 [Trametes cingulata]
MRSSLDLCRSYIRNQRGLEGRSYEREIIRRTTARAEDAAAMCAVSSVVAAAGRPRPLCGVLSIPKSFVPHVLTSKTSARA